VQGPDSAASPRLITPDKDTVRLQFLVWEAVFRGVIAVTEFLDGLTLPAAAM
jgi:hypothetical protein